MAAKVWHDECFMVGMLRITTNESERVIEMVLEGRVTGPWAEELHRVWLELVPHIDAKKLSIDLRNVTYADDKGKQVLVTMFSQADTELIADTIGTQYLAEQVRERSNAESAPKEAGNASNA